MVDQRPIPAFHFVNDLLHVLLPPIRILLRKIEWCFCVVVAKTDQIGPRQNNIKWVPYYTQDLLAFEWRCVWHAPGGVTLNNPNCVVYDVFSFHLLHLEHDVAMQRVISTSLHTS